MAGYSRSKNGVASLAYVPAIHVFFLAKTWMPAASAGMTNERSRADVEWLNTILQGILLGGLYAMFAAGLSLIFGVMRLVNIAHGDLIVLADYVALKAPTALGINPLVSQIVVVPAMALIGY